MHPVKYDLRVVSSIRCCIFMHLVHATYPFLQLFSVKVWHVLPDDQIAYIIHLARLLSECMS
jgi:hypothetical protein